MTTEQFKPFQRILVKNQVNEAWEADLFSHYDADGNPNCMVHNIDSEDDILPYKGNEHLVGLPAEEQTGADEEPAPKIGDWVVSLGDGWSKYAQFRIYKLTSILADTFLVNNRYITRMIVPFRRFDPDDITATRRNIYKPDNGQAVKAYRK